MTTGERMGALARLACVGCLTMGVLTGCGGGASDSATNESGDATGENDVSGGTTGESGTSTGVSGFFGADGPFGTLQDDPGLLHDLPEVLSTEVLADSGLQIAYTSVDQRAAIDPQFIGAQWQHMQTCLGVNAPAPYVVIIDGPVSPFVATDDVIRDISGLSLATASVTAEGTVVQITAADFDGSLGDEGFSLRSMLGRTLWLGENLALRDYPFACASSAPVAESG